MRPNTRFTQLGFLFRFVVVFLVGGLIGCTDSFEEKIYLARKAGITNVYPVGDGLAYFASRTMDSVWEPEPGIELARVSQLQMIDQRGQKIDESLFAAGPTFVAFIFTNCSGFCPMIVQNLKAIEDAAKGLRKPQLVAITVDPENDTPERLAQFAASQLKGRDQKNWYFLTGPRSQLTRIARDVFSIEAFKKEPVSRTVHSERIFLVDQKGFLRDVFNGTRGELKTQSVSSLRILVEASQW